MSECLFSLRLVILARICPSQTWFGLVLALAKLYALVATVRENPMVEEVRRGIIAGVGVAVYKDMQLKVGGHF